MKKIQRTLEHSIVLRRVFLLVGTLTVLLICTLILSAFITAKHAQAAQRNTRITYESIRINGGDSLWSIAQEYHGTKDTADFVEELRVLNNLSSDRIQSGSYILVPVTSVL